MAARVRRQKYANEAKRNEAVVRRVIKRYGPVIDLRRNPGVLIDMLRRFRNDVVSNDNPCGGTPQPPPSPGPSGAGARITNEDMMRAILRLTRDFNLLKKAVARR